MKKAKIYYFTLTDEMRKEEKLNWFRSHSIEQIEFEHIQPDKNNNWINLADNDFDSLLPLASKDVKSGKSIKAIFYLFSTGYLTGRDEWVVDYSFNCLLTKMRYYVEQYNAQIGNKNYNSNIKWSRNLKNRINRKLTEHFSKDIINQINHRPFIKKFIYNSKLFIDENGLFMQFPKNKNPIISFLCVYSSHLLSVLCSEGIVDYCYLKMGNGGTQCIPFYRYDESGNRFDNITDWALEQFRNHYHLSEPGFSGLKDEQDFAEAKKGKKSAKSVKKKNAEPEISKEDIFHYVYAVLHNPAYREKYELNLKREFPRIPFYSDFWKWAKWGKALMDLHIHYETVKPFDLKEHHAKTRGQRKEGEENSAPQPKIKPKLKTDKEKGIIELDEITFLSGIPKQAWEYKLGNRSALEWILDQYKEKKPRDPTIAEKFSTYRFADYKEHVTDLLKRVCTVSVETINIIDEMKKCQS